MKEWKNVIYFVRHGEYPGNIKQSFGSNIKIHDDKSLTDIGKLQSKLLGDFLKNGKFTIAFTSSYTRAVETAQIIIAETKQATQLRLDERLRERYFGVFHGLPSLELAKHFEAAKEQEVWQWEPQDSETHEEMRTRIENFLQDILDLIDKSEEPQMILVVSHGSFYLHFFHCLTQSSQYKVTKWRPKYEQKPMGNCTYFKFGVQK